ncbi:MAG: CoA-binding protein [Thiotrichaceae bacterium IS1]|nr:MAG: CoA-binding protein [Thiotrichaceae bacterium IS1]
MNKTEKVAVLGASPKDDRYSNKAVQALLNNDHQVFPIHPICAEIHGQRCFKQLTDLPDSIDTLTLYVGEEKSSELLEQILSIKPKRIIMNPGAENSILEEKALAQGIEVVRGCTLVMLRTGQF